MLMDGVSRMDVRRDFRQKVPSADYVAERFPDKGRLAGAIKAAYAEAQ